MGCRFSSSLVVAAALLALETLVFPRLASAGGMYIGENGGQALARAGAFVVKADDPSSMVHNPAGLAKTDGVQIYDTLYRFDLSGAYTQSDTITVTAAPIAQGGEADQPTTNAPIGAAGHPFNAGTYDNRYFILAVGVQAGW